ncbi:MAG: hypothetical protein KBT21_04020 [Treponema sp.]|nr:hypothetical protein [Candidatus Treponema merdequi]
MKKMLVGIFTVFACLFAIAGCSKPEVKNEFGWYEDYDACLESSKKSGKNIFLLVTRDDSDTVSKDLKAKMFYTSEFTEKYSSEYEFCVIDVSSDLFVKAFPEKNIPKDIREDEAKSKEWLKNANKEKSKYEKILEKRMKIVTVFGINTTPTLYVATKEGYVMNAITYFPSDKVEDFDEELESLKDGMSSYMNYVKTVEASKGLARVNAINDLYEATNHNYRYMITDLMREVEKLDKKNETGLVGKFLLAIATSDSTDLYLNRKAEKVPAVYEKVAKSSKLNADQKQQAYYAAAYIIGNNTPSPKVTEKLIYLLKKAIEINPETQIAQHCEGLLKQVEDFKIRQEEMNKKIEDEAKEE